MTDTQFPRAPFEQIGYHIATYGQKTYNGVAILSRQPPTHVQMGFEDATDTTGARLIGACIESVWVYSCYVPNGKIIGSEACATKIRWLQHLRQFLDDRHPAGENLSVCGDFNIARDDRDVHDPDFWRTQVLYHSSMRTTLETFLKNRFIDTFRLHHEEAEEYSWWDYRRLAFPKNRGLRIDYVFASQPLADTCTAADIDREARKGKLPSDHTPVWADFEPQKNS